MTLDSSYLFIEPHPDKPHGGRLALTRGEGIYVWDTEGNRYIDAMSGLWVVGVGHGREEIVEVAAEQMRRLGYVNSRECINEPAALLASKLASIAPPTLNHSLLGTSGSLAVEMALRLAKQYHYNRGERRRTKVIGRHGSYHGCTAGGLTVNFAWFNARPPSEPLAAGGIGIPGVDCFRCPYEKSYPSCNVFCARALEQYIVAEGPETIAAFIAEPIDVANRNEMPPPAYWPVVREICDRYGILLIADEVINAFGRTGKWFGCQHFDVEPDIITGAKGLASGYAPISATLVSDRVFEEFARDPSRHFGVVSTYGSHPVASAVALRNLEIIEREGLVENARQVGEHLMTRLNDLCQRHRFAGKARGVGLLCALQLVKDKESCHYFGRTEAAADLKLRLRKRGVLTGVDDRIYVAPPLCTSASQIDTIVDAIDDALTEFESEYRT